MLVRIAQRLQQPSYIVQAKLDPKLLGGIKPAERLFVGHFRAGDK